MDQIYIYVVFGMTRCGVGGCVPSRVVRLLITTYLLPKYLLTYLKYIRPCTVLLLCFSYSTLPPFLSIDTSRYADGRKNTSLHTSVFKKKKAMAF